VQPPSWGLKGFYFFDAPRWARGAFVESYVDEGISAKTTYRPAFQRLMRDIELGRTDTVMFTELSRLSRSLKDFLNIFEFAQRHACDLVRLKTEIDTTSPYQGLVTKILIVFSEFEREMTSRRTAINAYERSKRGLANGGQVLLGYRRDKKHKGGSDQGSLPGQEPATEADHSRQNLLRADQPGLHRVPADQQAR
jgi:DNA invertase Pin-like site-specific DNA recombinase